MSSESTIVRVTLPSITSVGVSNASPSTRVASTQVIGPRGPAGPEGPPGADGSGPGVTDHGDLEGLLDNDHPQYGKLITNPEDLQEWTGANTFEEVSVTPPAVDVVPFTIDGLSGQTANLQEWKTNNVIKAYLDENGIFRSAVLELDASMYISTIGSPSILWDGAAGDNLDYLVFNRSDNRWEFQIDQVPLLGIGGGVTTALVAINALGTIISKASQTTASGLRLPPGVAPTSPVDGDIWLTDEGVFAQIDGTTVDLTDAGAGVTDHGSLTGLLDNDHTQYGLLETTPGLVGQEWIGSQQFKTDDATTCPVFFMSEDGVPGENQAVWVVDHEGTFPAYATGKGWLKGKLVLFGEGGSYVEDTETAYGANNGIVQLVAGTGSFIHFNRADGVWTVSSEGKVLATFNPDAPYHSLRAITTEAGKIPLGAIQTHATPTVDVFQCEIGGTVIWAIDKDGRIKNRNSTLIIDGTGTPEGSATAPVGSLYLRTNGEIWKKLTGAGNTGWVRILDAALFDAKGDIIAATADNTASRLAIGTNGHVLTADSAEATGLKWAAAPTAAGRIIRITVDGGGSAITTGAKKVYVSVPFTCTINKVRLLADVSGSVVVDIWKDTYANYPPTVADTIVASAKPTLSSAIKTEDSTLTGWTTALTAGDILEVNIDSASTITKLHIDLFVS